MREPRGRLGRLGRRAGRRPRALRARTACTCTRSALSDATRSRTTTRASATTPCGRSTTTSSSGVLPPGLVGDLPGRQPALRRGRRRGRGAGRDRLGARLPAAARARRWSASCGPTCASAGSTTSPSRRVELFAQLPWRRGICSRGCSAPTSWASSGSPTPRTSSAPAASCCGAPTKGDVVVSPQREGSPTPVRASAIPISIDFAGAGGAGQRPEVMARAAEIRQPLGDPKILMLGVDRLDYTKGIRHRLKAYEELLRRRRDRAAGRHPRAGRDPQPRAASTPTATCAPRSS